MTTSKENTVQEVNKAVSSEPMFTKKDLRKMCWRSLTGGFSVNWDRYVHKTFTFMIAPMLKRIYKNDHEGYVKALQRNMEFFNITPQVHAFMGGLTVAMEEQNAKDPDFDPKTINCPAFSTRSSPARCASLPPASASRWPRRATSWGPSCMRLSTVFRLTSAASRAARSATASARAFWISCRPPA